MILIRLNEDKTEESWFEKAKAYLKKKYLLEPNDIGLDKDTETGIGEGEEPDEFVDRMAEKYDLDPVMENKDGDFKYKYKGKTVTVLKGTGDDVVEVQDEDGKKFNVEVADLEKITENKTARVSKGDKVVIKSSREKGLVKTNLLKGDTYNVEVNGKITAIHKDNLRLDEAKSDIGDNDIKNYAKYYKGVQATEVADADKYPHIYDFGEDAAACEALRGKVDNDVKQLEGKNVIAISKKVHEDKSGAPKAWDVDYYWKDDKKNKLSGVIRMGEYKEGENEDEDENTFFWVKNEEEFKNLLKKDSKEDFVITAHSVNTDTNEAKKDDAPHITRAEFSEIVKKHADDSEDADGVIEKLSATEDSDTQVKPDQLWYEDVMDELPTSGKKVVKEIRELMADKAESEDMDESADPAKALDTANGADAKKLPETYSQPGPNPFKFKQVERTDKAAIYQITDKEEGDVDLWEVIKIVVKPAKTIKAGGVPRMVPKREKLPSSEDFGHTAWSYYEKDKAYAKYNSIK